MIDQCFLLKLHHKAILIEGIVGVAAIIAGIMTESLLPITAALLVVIIAISWRGLEKLESTIPEKLDSISEKLDSAFNGSSQAQFVEQEDVLEYYRKIKEEARTECFLTWCANFKHSDEEMIKYFDHEIQVHEKSNGRLTIQRLINRSKGKVCKKEFDLHCEKTKHLSKDQYEYKLSDIKDIEIAYADHMDNKKSHQRAMLVFVQGDDEDPRKAIYFDTKTSESNRPITSVIRTMFLKEWERKLDESEND